MHFCWCVLSVFSRVLISDLDTFFQDTALGRQAKLFTCLLSIENKVDSFRSATPPYQLSEELKVSMISYLVLVDVHTDEPFIVDQHK